MWSATSSRAAAGASPMSSESSMLTPSFRASRSTVSQMCQSDVLAWSSRFMESWTHPCDARSMPSACTAGSPPSRSRTWLASRRATATSVVDSWMFQAMRKGRAPTTVAPAVGCGRGWPEVRLVGRLAHGLRETLESGPSDVGQDAPVGAEGGLGIEEDGQVEALGQAGGEAARTLDTLLHGRVAEGHEGDDVHGPDARMLAPLHAHVDAFDGHLDRTLHGRHHAARVARHGVDAALMVRVSRLVQEPDAARGRG